MFLGRDNAPKGGAKIDLKSEIPNHNSLKNRNLDRELQVSDYNLILNPTSNPNMRGWTVLMLLGCPQSK
jgi:hypothetical protein